MFRNKQFRIWFIITCVLIVIFVAANLLLLRFGNLVNQVLGGERMKIIGENTNVYKTLDGCDTKTSALDHGNKVSIKACEEGFVLLKNQNALPLESGAKISIFGKNSVSMAIGGSGSGGGATDDKKDIFDSLKQSGFEYNKTLYDFYMDDKQSGEVRTANPKDLDNGAPVGMQNLSTGETPQVKYTDAIKKSYNNYSDAALIVITRIGGEGFDLPAADDGSHFLQLDANENALIETVSSSGIFKHVVIILNSPSSLELQHVQRNDKVDGIMWIGYPGAYGIMALGELLKGETLEGEKISPSGKTVDTYAAHLKNSPAWCNFGGALNIDVGGGKNGDSYFVQQGSKLREQMAYFADYEEGIYVGYKYYETAYAEALAGNYSGFDYDSEVVYPFGYGLSYTDFSIELENSTQLQSTSLTKDTSLTFNVKVKNTGKYAGKETVQLYVTAPYTKGGIEKSAKVLVGFEKTDLLQPGKSQALKITVESPYVYASYDYNDANKNGFKGYEVESGDYTFSISTNAHSVISSVKINCKNDISYSGAVNRYTDQSERGDNSNADLGSILSRANFTGTWPAARTLEERMTTKEWVDAIKSSESNHNNPNEYSKMPTTNYSKETVTDEDGNIISAPVSFLDLAGADYDDERWEEFLDRFTVAEMTALVNEGAFGTIGIKRLGVPMTIAADGPVGFRNFIGGAAIYDTCVYPCEVVLASTWNTEILFDMGESVGNEGLVGDIKNGSTPYTGWYAPGQNIHRSSLGGRNFEYYSEDGLLSGKMSAAVVKGADSMGVYTSLKHFALNEQETHRSSYGGMSWVDEQTMREIYLKPFEIAVKEGNSKSVMSSFNRIGQRWTGGDYRLITGILREEWGFKGFVITDFNTNSYMNVRDMIYAGGDLNLEAAKQYVFTPDGSNAGDVQVLRNATKNILYVIANSNAMRGDFILQPPLWQIILYVVDGVVALGLIAWGIIVIIQTKRKQKERLI